MKIIIKNLSKKYIKNKNENLILDDINIEFESGKLYMIVGESGAGKTTFLKCLSLLTDVDSGIVKINNICINNFNDQELSDFRSKNIGIIFQEYNLLNFFTSFENVILPSLKINNKEILDDKAKELLDYVGLKNKINSYPQELSGGEKQRVAIARALINEPGIILADEPTGNVDNKNKIKIIEMLKKISRENKCVIVVTHDNEISKYADKIYLLEKGKLIDYED